MSKVIKFPDSKTKKAQELRKAEGRRVFLTLSMVSLVLMAVFINDHLLNSYRPVYLVSDNTNTKDIPTRRIANSDEYASIYRDIQWERELAMKLSESRGPATVAKKSNLIDQFQYTELKGRYDIGMESSKVYSLKYKDGVSAGGDPIFIENIAQFLVKYHQVFKVTFAHVQRVEGHKYILLSSKDEVMGEAQVELDSQGRLLQITIK